MSYRTKALFFCVIKLILNILVLSTSVKAARMELNEEESTFSISCSAFAYAGAVSNSDGYQYSIMNHDPFDISVSASDFAFATTGSACGWNTLIGDYAGGAHWLIWDWDGVSFPYVGEDIVIPAGFSVSMNAEGNLVWEILPSTENEDQNIPVFLYIDYRLTSFDEGSGVNINYEMGIYDYTFGPETETSGPYYMELYCCPGGQNSTFPEEGYLYTFAHFGDSFRFSYDTSVNGGTINPVLSSDIGVPLVEVFLFIAVYSPNIFFLDREQFEYVEGACSDGETRVSVMLGLPYELFPDDENPSCIRLTVLSDDGKDNGHLIQEGQDNDGDDYDDTPRVADCVFTQTWCAPAVFDSVEGAANTAKTREIPIQFELDIDKDGTYECVFVKNIELIRPPVVMVHGLWGNPGDFSKLKNTLAANGWLYSYLASYDKKASFLTNIPTVMSEITNALRATRMAGYAVKKVDVVAHSMGGLLVKKLDTYFAQENIRKIITIGSPYMGSPLADDLYKLLAQDPVGAQRLEKILNLNFGITNSITGGAIADLRSENNPQLPISTQVLGVDCQEIFVGLRDGTTSDWLLNTFVTGLMLLYRQWTPEATHHIIFGTANSDWVVPESSQIYDAPQHHTLYVPWHCVEPKNDVFIDHTISTLNQAADIGQTIAASCLKVNSTLESLQQQYEPAVIEFSNVLLSNPNGTVEIVNPIEGQICEAGESITVSVQGTGDTSHVAVFAFFGASSWADITQLPWVGDVNIPSDSVGSVAKIFAIGLDANMNMTADDEVNLILESDIVLQEIFFGFGDIWYFDFITNPTQSHQLQLYPMGRFSDGSEHPLSVLSGQTTYESSKESIVTVDSNGLLIVHSVGIASILVRNSYVTATFSVEVDAYPYELNLDGIVNFSDFAMFALHWMETGCSSPGWCGKCDSDSSGIVDFADLAVFAENWLFETEITTEVGDFNDDGKVNFVDLSLFINDWLKNSAVTDIAPLPNGDGIVNFLDFSLFAEHWLEGTAS